MERIGPGASCGENHACARVHWFSDGVRWSPLFYAWFADCPRAFSGWSGNAFPRPSRSRFVPCPPISLNFVRDLHSFSEASHPGSLDGAYMHEDIFAALIGLNEDTPSSR